MCHQAVPDTQGSGSSGPRSSWSWWGNKHHWWKHTHSSRDKSQDPERHPSFQLSWSRASIWIAGYPPDGLERGLGVRFPCWMQPARYSLRTGLRQKWPTSHIILLWKNPTGNKSDSEKNHPLTKLSILYLASNRMLSQGFAEVYQRFKGLLAGHWCFNDLETQSREEL